MKASTKSLRWFTVIDVAACASVCYYLEWEWYTKVLAIISGFIAIVCTIWDLHVSKGEWYHDYMYLYFRKEKPKGVTRSANNRSRVRFIIRTAIMVMLVYLCVRCTYHEFVSTGNASLTQIVFSIVNVLALFAPINMFWVWKIESKMKE